MAVEVRLPPVTLSVRLVTNVTRVTADTGALTKSLNAMPKAMNSVNQSASGAAKSLSAMHTAVLSVGFAVFALDRMFKQFVLQPFIMAMGAAVKAASEFVEANNRFREVFSRNGVMIQGATNALHQLAGALHLSELSMNRMLGATGDLLVGWGFTEEQALFLAAAAAKLGGDLASFADIEGGAAEATDRITKAMMGLTRNVRLLGVVVRKTDKDFKALSKELQMQRGFSKNAADAFATLELAFRQSPKAIGDLERTIFSMANQMRVSNENLIDLRTNFGLLLIDTLALDKVLMHLNRILRAGADLFRRIRENAGDKTAIAIVSVAIAFTALAAAILALIPIVLVMLIGLAGGAPALGAIGAAALLVGAAVGVLLTKFVLMLYLIGRGETFMERLADGMKQLVDLFLQVGGFLVNIAHNIEVAWQRWASSWLESILKLRIAWNEFMGDLEQVEDLQKQLKSVQLGRQDLEFRVKVAGVDPKLDNILKLAEAAFGQGKATVDVQINPIGGGQMALAGTQQAIAIIARGQTMALDGILEENQKQTLILDEMLKDGIQIRGQTRGD